MPEKIYVGADIGGTAIKVGICNESGDLLQTYEGPTGTEQGTDRILGNIAGYARHVVSESPYTWDQVAGVGIGIAGFMDFDKGFIKFSPNLPLTNVPLKDHLEAVLNKPVRVNNDANVAALGEAWGGAGRGISSVVCYTLGTGVGGGIVVGGRLIEGFSGMGGELGHMSIVPDLEAIQCGCGKMGCLETVSSATGIIRMAKDAVERGDRTTLSLIETITAKDVVDAAKNGDEVAQRIVSRAAYYLGKSMATVAVIVNPQRFILGGGVSKAGEFLFAQIREVFHKYAQDKAQEGVDIVAAELGNNAGVVGAAGLMHNA
ncbi:ROK family glucokinase [Cohnella sp. CFH 77786]|uniref:ROK family glucokinase n=1 Tax=Cohnella sp. CFH 77786 TaxID=2662265 RepID=UPI001C608CA7|nr:ROK family glucokinase [Cohnella sp. CFH 77786]MBW5448972.1 ROK family glucokinase [Cohnella sp. CFH 77786]